MKQTISMTQRHRDSGEILLRYDGEAEVEEQGKRTHIRLRCEEPACRIELYAYGDAMVLHHHSIQRTKLSFREGRTTLAHVENELGAITLRLRTDRYERPPTHIHVDYAIMDGADGSDTFEFRIEMRGGRK